MRLTSSAFASGQRLPDHVTLDGGNRSPALGWTGVPPAAKSLVLLCEDPDAPRGTWHHWAAYDLPATLAGLAEGADVAALGGRLAVNDFGRQRYDGPAPPRGHGTHHYHFRLLALDVARLGVPEAPRCADVAALARPHVLAEAELVGTFAR